MICLKVVIIIAAFLQKLVFSQNALPTRHNLVDKKLSDDQLFFVVNVATEAHCQYVCIQNRLCLVVVYKDTGSFCSGYKTMSESEALDTDERARHVVREGICISLF